MFVMHVIANLHTIPLGDVPGNATTVKITKQVKRFQLRDFDILKDRIFVEWLRLIWYFNRHLHLLGDAFRLLDKVGRTSHFNGQ